jgi:2-oxoglutarate ferredoxin oxidoreductase subunit gamma
MHEIRFSGLGGQGIIRSGFIVSSQLLVSEERILYPYITKPQILVSMSREAYEKYEPELKEDGILIVDEDLVEAKPRAKIRIFKIPATRFAEELGNRIIANLVMLGFFTAVTDVVSYDAMKKAIPGSVPDRALALNMKGFEKGYAYGKDYLKKSQ